LNLKIYEITVKHLILKNTKIEINLFKINSFLFILFIVSFISLILIILGILLRVKKTKCVKIISPFECGFFIKYWYRKPFRLHFLRLRLIFLIFDLELILLFPLFSNLNLSFRYLNIFSFLIFLLILTLLLFLEWNQLILEWIS